jgi:hypothetical protein
MEAKLRRLLLTLILSVLLVGVVSTGPAWARANATATEICTDSSGTVVLTTTIDLNALGAFRLADSHVNATPLGVTCVTNPD